MSEDEFVLRVKKEGLLDEDPTELAALLRDVAGRVALGHKAGRIVDRNGTGVGQFKYETQKG